MRNPRVFHKGRCRLQVHVEFSNDSDIIKVEGPPDESERARELLEKQVKELVAKTTFVEINVDAKYHKHIIGKGGSTGECVYVLHREKLSDLGTLDDKTCA